MEKVLFDLLYNGFNSRSREGSDASGSFSSLVGIVFQFTLPRGERQRTLL